MKLIGIDLDAESLFVLEMISYIHSTIFCSIFQVE